MGHLDSGHTHEHTHDGVTHTHEHTHPHDHTHEELHAENGAVSEQTVAVLKYMLEHNIHHAAELSDLAQQLIWVSVTSTSVMRCRCTSITTPKSALPPWSC